MDIPQPPSTDYHLPASNKMENYLKEMLVTLANAQVEFVVGGGVACVLHGVERVTLDLDIAVQITPQNLNRLIDAVERLKLRPRVPVSLADIGDPDFVRSMVVEKGALVFSLADFAQPLRHLDIFLSPTLSFERLSEGAALFDIGGVNIRVVSRELLIEIKKEIKPPRPKDILDLNELARLMKKDAP
jgi:hypothetical protein